MSHSGHTCLSQGFKGRSKGRSLKGVKLFSKFTVFFWHKLTLAPKTSSAALCLFPSLSCLTCSASQTPRSSLTIKGQLTVLQNYKHRGLPVLEFYHQEYQILLSSHWYSNSKQLFELAHSNCKRGPLFSCAS